MKTLDLKREINLDITPHCNLKCPGCQRQILYSDKKVPGENISVESFEKIADYFDWIFMCGQISDPTFHPDLKSLLEVVVKKNKNTVISVASSWRSPLWFEEMFDYSAQHKNIAWTFGIDGLPKDSHKYRKNQDGEKLFSMMELCASKGIQTTWQYIAFNYNEDDIEVFDGTTDHQQPGYLDAQGRKQGKFKFYEYIKKNQLGKNYSIVIVTHSMQQAARISQRTAYFHLGELIEVGETKKIFTMPKDKQTEAYISGRIG